MPPGNQAAAYTLASSFAMVVAKCRMLLPTPFSFLPPSFIYWFCFYRHYSHLLQKKWEFCIPIPFGIEEKKGPPLCKNALVHNGRAAHAAGKIFRAFQIVPPSLRAVWESPWGSDFHAIWSIKHCSPPFFFGGSFCVSHSLRDWGKKWGPPLCKNALVHNGRVSPCRGKNLLRFPNCPAIAPGGLGKPLGFEFP